MISRSPEYDGPDRILRDPAGINEIADLIRTALNVDAAVITVIEADQQRLIASAGVAQPYSSVCEFPREAAFVSNLHEERVLADSISLKGIGIAAYAGAPIRDAAGGVLGIVCAINQTPRAWSARDRVLLEQLTSVASTELKRSIEAADVEVERIRLELSDTLLLQSVSAAMVREDNIDELYKMFVDSAVKVMRSDYGTMQALVSGQGESEQLVLLASQGLDEQARSYWRCVSADAGSTCGQALQTRSRVIAEDFRHCSFALRRNDLEAFIGSGILSAQSTPLYSRKGQLLGMISTHWKKPHRPSDHDLRLLDILARQAADTLERRFAEKVLRESEQRFRAFVETSFDVVYRMNADWSQMRSLDGREVISDTTAPSREWIGGYIYPGDQATVSTRIIEAIATKSTFDFEHRVIRANGTLGWTHLRAIPLLDENGDITEWFGTASDVTLKKQAEMQQEEALRESQRVTETLQAAFLPHTLPRVPGLQFDAAYLAAEEGALIGGDWYDASVLPDGRLLLCVGDVTGHGLSAAVTAGRLRQTATTAALTMSDPVDVLNLLNRVLRFQQPEMYATAMVAFIDPDCTEITYATAGHPPAFLADADALAVTELRVGGLTLGVADSLEAQTHRLELPENFVLALYSDGLTEFARDVSRAEEALKHAMLSLVTKAAKLPAAAAVLDGVLGNARPSDDVVILVVSRNAR